MLLPVDQRAKETQQQAVGPPRVLGDAQKVGVPIALVDAEGETGTPPLPAAVYITYAEGADPDQREAAHTAENSKHIHTAVSSDS